MFEYSLYDFYEFLRREQFFTDLTYLDSMDYSSFGIPKSDDYIYQYEVDKYVAEELFDAIRLLDLPEQFTEEQLHGAYRKKVKTAHPDGGGSHEEFLRVREAYEYLKRYFNID